MRILFVFTSCLLAISLSILVSIIASGVVPFHTPVQIEQEQGVTVEDGQSVETRDEISIFNVQSKLVDDLVADLKAKIEQNKDKELSLKASEEELDRKIEQMKSLESTLTTLREEVAGKIIQISENEENNFKKMAEMFGKMEPDNAAQLLRKSDPDRSAKIISLVNDRQAAAIMNAAVGTGDAGIIKAAEWTDALRRMSPAKKAQM